MIATPKSTNIQDRLALLREKMKALGLAAYIVPGTDPHQSEYVAPHWKGRDWISGFDGSAGTVVVTADFAGLWTDFRYFIQAVDQLAGSTVSLQKQVTQGAPEHIDWLVDHLSSGDKVGIDGKLFSVASVEQMKKNFATKGIELVIGGDLFKDIWADRPFIPGAPIYDHSLVYAGISRTGKLKLIREQMAEKEADFHLLTALDDIAWTFNLRGSDVDYNPVAICYAIIGKENAYLFIDNAKVPDPFEKELINDGLTLKPYEDIDDALQALPHGSSILIDPGKTSQWLFESIEETCIIRKSSTLPMGLKALKNETEIAHARTTMVKDGVAMVKFLKWVEETVGKGEISEVSAAKQLFEFRSEQENFIGESFGTIAGYKGDGAIVHYRATEATDVALQPEGLFLVDSGGQYLDGTTDITRTITLGSPTQEEIADFTLVLKGHIALNTAVFPEGTSGGQLDVLARNAMWAQAIDYGHGTGHGVGFFLNVHEPPQRIGQGRSASLNTPMQVGMITSNEPGIYREGKHGIRIENLILTVPHVENDFGTFLKFENLTWCPIDTRLIDVEMLTKAERTWFNEYHETVFEKLSPYLDEETSLWLRGKTAAI